MKRNNIIILLCVLFLIFSGVGVARKSHKHHSYKKTSQPRIFIPDISADAGIDQAINKIIKAYDPTINVGVQVQSMGTGAVIYQLNANRLFMPASSLKIFTAASALKELHPDYQFKTKIITKRSSTISGGTLNGDVYFYFSGDPLLKHYHLNSMVSALKKAGINNINGNVYLDDTAFDQDNYGPGWMWDEENLCYAAPTSAINIDKNCVPFTMISGREGNMARVFVNHEHSFVKVVNTTQSKKSSEYDCPFRVKVTDANIYYMSGCVWPRSDEISFAVAVKNIRLYAAEVIAKILSEHKISYNGEIKFGKSIISENPNAVVNNDYYLLAENTSAPLSSVVKIMLKKSDNQIADSLFKKLGNSYLNKTGGWKSGSLALREILAKNGGIDFGNVRIVDGSGLSHYNLVTPAKMSKLLDYAYHDEAIREPFYKGLPISGVDGSLTYRLSSPGLVSKVHAKTGTMKGIVALAGYMTTDSGKTLSFVVIMNDFIGSYARYRQMADSIAAWFIRNY